MWVTPRAHWRIMDTGWALYVDWPEGGSWCAARVDAHGYSVWPDPEADWPCAEGPETGHDGIMEATDIFLSKQPETDVVFS